jgi:hypothetical protein
LTKYDHRIGRAWNSAQQRHSPDWQGDAAKRFCMFLLLIRFFTGLLIPCHLVMATLKNLRISIVDSTENNVISI